MYCRFTFVENTIRISPKVATAKFLGNDRLFCFIVSIIKFGSFKKAFTVITSLSEFHFRFERFTLLVKKKEVISMSYSSSTSSWKPWIWMRLVLIFKAKDIYTNTPITSQQKISQMIKKTVPISKKIATNCAMKRSIMFCVWRKVNGNWDKSIIRNSNWKESHCRTNTKVWRNK